MFYNCLELEKVVIEDGTDELILEYGAFANCSKLIRVEFGGNAKIAIHSFACEENKDIELILYNVNQLQIEDDSLYNRTAKKTDLLTVG